MGRTLNIDFTGVTDPGGFLPPPVPKKPRSSKIQGEAIFTLAELYKQFDRVVLSGDKRSIRINGSHPRIVHRYPPANLLIFQYKNTLYMVKEEK